jgi:uncharacterized protein (TIGR02996 family)
MDDEPALLAAIEARPDDDTPRLAYADWLDEHAADLPDPDAARIRAEFVRVQCAIKRVEALPGDQQRPHVHLWQRQQHLLDHHRRDLLGPLGGELTYFDAIFDRGFVQQLIVTADLFLRYAEAIRVLWPRPRVRVTEAQGELIPALLVLPELELIEALTVVLVDDVTTGACDLVWVAESLATCSNLGGLEVLEMPSCYIGDTGLEAIARSRRLPRLIELDLQENEISELGVRSLVESPLWPRLRRLGLRRNPLGDGAAEVLALAAADSQLEHLDLRNAGIGPDGHRLLLRAYKGGRLTLF